MDTGLNQTKCFLPSKQILNIENTVQTTCQDYRPLIPKLQSNKTIFGTKYSKVDQANFVEDSL